MSLHTPHLCTIVPTAFSSSSPVGSCAPFKVWLSSSSWVEPFAVPITPATEHSRLRGTHHILFEGTSPPCVCFTELTLLEDKAFLIHRVEVPDVRGNSPARGESRHLLLARERQAGMAMLRAQGRSDSSDVGFSSGSHTSNEATRRDEWTPLESKLGAKGPRGSALGGRVTRRSVHQEMRM